MEWLLLVLCGMLVGFLAGLLGIGGGGLLVPILTTYFLSQQVDVSQAVHMALATSLSCIIINAIISTWAHQKHHAILWPMVLKLMIFYALGSFFAGLTAVHLNSQTLAIIFASMMILIALQMISGKKTDTHSIRDISHWKVITGGTVIGYLSALLAIGGGSLTVPFLHMHGIPLKKAIATAAALGMPIALAGTLAFISFGQNTSPLAINSIGFVYWPATLALTAGASITTTLGARTTHHLPVNLLKNIFALLLIVLSFKMYHSIVV